MVFRNKHILKALALDGVFQKSLYLPAYQIHVIAVNLVFGKRPREKISEVIAQSNITDSSLCTAPTGLQGSFRIFCLALCRNRIQPGTRFKTRITKNTVICYLQDNSRRIPFDTSIRRDRRLRNTEKPRHTITSQTREPCEPLRSRIRNETDLLIYQVETAGGRVIGSSVHAALSRGGIQGETGSSQKQERFPPDRVVPAGNRCNL